ncbi:MAG: type I-E CRISPR-associated protein Cas7/Cse4/CasC [Clostridia bacterium]|nr:type I-E CRISPR-associated protein Cas7/Cse4/CasC [Clostridia bacterium]
MNKLFIDIHVLQNVPPSCINRDDTGSPKTAVFGGVTRARVSSQCWKRAVRLSFMESFPREKLGFRTKKIVKLLSQAIMELDSSLSEEQAEKKAENVLNAVELKGKKAKASTDALFFISAAQISALAELAIENAKEASAKELKQRTAEALRKQPGVDIALFGRMVASNPSLNTDACAQVAHALSTHKVSNEYDYFTAVDDCAPEDNAGAAHLDTVEYNSSTLYRYATVAVHELNKHLGDETAHMVGSFVRAFVRSMPTGKQNTFANQTLPFAVMLCLRSDQPINLVGAFEKPITSRDNGYSEESALKLVEYAKDVWDDFAAQPDLVLVTGKALSRIAEPQPFDSMLDKLETEIDNRFASGEAK